MECKDKSVQGNAETNMQRNIIVRGEPDKHASRECEEDCGPPNRRERHWKRTSRRRTQKERFHFGFP